MSKTERHLTKLLGEKRLAASNPPDFLASLGISTGCLRNVNDLRVEKEQCAGFSAYFVWCRDQIGTALGTNKAEAERTIEEIPT